MTNKLLKTLTDILLFLIAYILFLPLSLINLVIVAIKKKSIQGYFFNAALSLDMYGNREFRTLWNTILRTSQGYDFGREQETISSALGKNLLLKKLSIPGKLLVLLLNFLDKDHCVKSVKVFPGEYYAELIANYYKTKKK